MQKKRKHPEIPAAPQGLGFFGLVFEQFRLTWALLMDNRVSLPLKFIPIIGIAYLLSPIDLVLMLLPLLGLLVDLAVVLMAVTVFNNLAPADVVAEHLTRMRIRSHIRISHDKDGTVIDITMPKQSEQTDDPLEGESPSPKQKASRH